MITVRPETVNRAASGDADWVLLVIADEGNQLSVRRHWESAGFGVEVVSNARDALECLKVMTPSLVVIEDRLFRRAPS